MSIITILICQFSLVSAATITIPIYQLPFNEVNIRKCVTVTQNNRAVDVPYGAWIFGYIVDDPDTFEPVNWSEVGIYEKGYPHALPSHRYGTITTWSLKTVKRPGSAQTTAHFEFCATVKTLPATGQFWLEVQAQWDT